MIIQYKFQNSDDLANTIFSNAYKDDKTMKKSKVMVNQNQDSVYIRWSWGKEEEIIREGHIAHF